MFSLEEEELIKEFSSAKRDLLISEWVMGFKMIKSDIKSYCLIMLRKEVVKYSSSTQAYWKMKVILDFILLMNWEMLVLWMIDSRTSKSLIFSASSCELKRDWKLDLLSSKLSSLSTYLAD